MATQITARELAETDIIVLNPNAAPVHEIRKVELAITRQKYGVLYTFMEVVDGVRVGRAKQTLRYADRVWVER